MNIESFLGDFDYLYNALKQHPLFSKNREIAEFEKFYRELRENIVDYTSFINAMTKLTTFFEDGHTNIEMPYTTQDYCLRITCEWQDNKLILQEDYEDIKAGSEIFAIEGQSVEQILERMSNRIPHENIFLVKSRMIEYPYMNYHIFSKMNLAELFGDKQVFEIVFLVDRTKRTKQCVLTKYDGFLDFSEGNSVYYELQDDKAVLHLDECICDKQYTDTLNELAILCNEKDIEMLEIDLSKNMGGSSAVIDEFIKYVDVDSFSRYEMIDYSSGNPRIVTSRADIICNQRKDALFPKNLICRVSNTTFSSARTFAVTLKDNGIATIVGQPTGGKPCSYGMPRRDITPNCNIRFRVSRALFLRPDEKLDEEVALFPDDKCIGI